MAKFGVGAAHRRHHVEKWTNVCVDCRRGCILWRRWTVQANVVKKCVRFIWVQDHGEVGQSSHSSLQQVDGLLCRTPVWTEWSLLHHWLLFYTRTGLNPALSPIRRHSLTPFAGWSQDSDWSALPTWLFGGGSQSTRAVQLRTAPTVSYRPGRQTLPPVQL